MKRPTMTLQSEAERITRIRRGKPRTHEPSALSREDCSYGHCVTQDSAMSLRGNHARSASLALRRARLMR